MKFYNKVKKILEQPRYINLRESVLSQYNFNYFNGLPELVNINGYKFVEDTDIIKNDNKMYVVGLDLNSKEVIFAMDYSFVPEYGKNIVEVAEILKAKKAGLNGIMDWLYENYLLVKYAGIATHNDQSAVSESIWKKLITRHIKDKNVYYVDGDELQAGKFKISNINELNDIILNKSPWGDLEINEYKIFIIENK